MLPAQGVPKNGELSLRIRREVAEATGTKGEDAKERLYAALNAIGNAMQVRCSPKVLKAFGHSCKSVCITKSLGHAARPQLWAVVLLAGCM
jgi:hypothetical protein